MGNHERRGHVIKKNVRTKIVALIIVVGVILQQRVVLANEISGLTEQNDKSSLGYLENQVIVTMEQGNSVHDLPQINEDTESIEELDAENQIAIVETDDIEKTISELEQCPEVQSVQPNYIYTLMDSIVVNDPFSEIQWSLNNPNIQLKKAWELSKVEGKVRIGILDTGIQMTHPDLQGNLNKELSYDAVTGNNNVKDDIGHGTHVAGIIAASANNGIGIAGASYNAEIIAYNVFEYSAQSNGYVAYTSSLVSAYKKAMTDGVKVINMSLGKYGKLDQTDQLLNSYIEEAANHGIVTVCAGGNGDKNGNPYTDTSFPADLEVCISVVPTDTNNQRPHYADYNSAKDIAAPGVGIYSTLPGSSYGYKSGSSMAAPFVTSVIAMMLTVNPELSVDLIKEALYTTTLDLGTSGKDDFYGWGLVNAYEAVKNVVPNKTIGWIQDERGWKYWNGDGTFAKAQWRWINDAWYYFDLNGYRASGWIFDAKWYYLSTENGKMLKGHQFIDNEWYYLKDNGEMVTGWLWADEQWKFYKSSGNMAVNWIWDGNKWYYLDDKGKMITGWRFINNKWYYFSPNTGEMVVGWQFIDWKWYYFYGINNGQMAAHAWIDGYYVGWDGAWVN